MVDMGLILKQSPKSYATDRSLVKKVFLFCLRFAAVAR